MWFLHECTKKSEKNKPKQTNSLDRKSTHNNRIQHLDVRNIHNPEPYTITYNLKPNAERNMELRRSTPMVENNYATTITSLTTIMITFGAITLLGPILRTKIHQKQVLKTFTDSLELASTEKFEIR